MGEFLEGIKGYNDVEITEIGNKPKDIVPGAYVLKIKQAKIERYSASSIAIKLMFDIAEGEYKGYYDELYKYNKSGQYAEQAKWKGTLKIWYPTESDDPENYKKSVANLKRAITAINDSNSGKKIDPEKGINLDDFKNKIVGGAFGFVDWSMDGRTGTKCECRWLVSAEKARSGDVAIPKHKGLKGAEPLSETDNKQESTVSEPLQQGGDLGDFAEIISDGDIPF